MMLSLMLAFMLGVGSLVETLCSFCFVFFSWCLCEDHHSMLLVFKKISLFFSFFGKCVMDVLACLPALRANLTA